MRYLFICLLVVSAGMLSFKNSSTTGYEVGDTAIDFKLPNAADNVNGIDKNVSLTDYKNAKGYIVIFTCNHCPFSVAYEDRIIALQNKYKEKGYPVIAINPNDAKEYPDDSYANMKDRAVSKSFNFAYLHDESQQIAKTYGALKTPHVYILDAKKTIKYIGAIDDSPWKAEKVKERYAENALDELLAGKAVTKTATKAVGCSIKWKK